METILDDKTPKTQRHWQSPAGPAPRAGSAPIGSHGAPMSRNDYKKRLDELTSQARNQDWTVTPTHSGHMKFIPPEKDKPLVIAAATTTDHRAAANLLSQLRRSGFRDR